MRAVFLDKDGTLVDDVPCNVDPALLVLARNAGPALRLLRSLGYRLYVISNQSGVARGRFDEAALGPLFAQLEAMLAGEGVALDGVARRRLAQIGIGAQARWLLMHPGATAASRRYPPELWPGALRLVASDGLPVVFTGSSDDGLLVDEMWARAGVPAHSLAGAATLGQLGALISLATVMVSNNTGPAHIAAALGTPLVDLYAQTNPQHTPWQSPSRVLFNDVPCRDCYKSICPMGHHDCLRKVAPAQVADAVRSLLAEFAPD